MICVLRVIQKSSKISGDTKSEFNIISVRIVFGKVKVSLKKSYEPQLVEQQCIKTSPPK